MSERVLFERFHVIKRIAFGAFSVVYEVRDQKTNEIVCLKVEKLDQNVVSMIKHEFAVATTLKSNLICKAYDFFEAGNKKAYSMELLSHNLADIRRNRAQPPSLNVLMSLTLKCLNCLVNMHLQNVIHCDVKPSNFACRRLKDDYDVVVLDFGLSKCANEDPIITTFRREMRRNPRYLSVSVLKGADCTAADDYISLLYTVSDFWRNELPWDGRMTPKLVLEVKDGYNMKELLPEEMGFLVDLIGKDEEYICAMINERLPERNIEAELHYLFDPPDSNAKPKLIKFIHENEQRKSDSNQHSA